MTTINIIKNFGFLIIKNKIRFENLKNEYIITNELYFQRLMKTLTVRIVELNTKGELTTIGMNRIHEEYQYGFIQNYSKAKKQQHMSFMMNLIILRWFNDDGLITYRRKIINEIKNEEND